MGVRWNSIFVDLPIIFIFLLLNLVDKSSQTRNQDKWEHVKIRYGFWHELPQYDTVATAEGYERLNDVCKTDNYHGFLFSKKGNTKVMPIYDLNGNLAGVQSAIPGNMKGYNSLNETIDLPPIEIMPPVLRGGRDAKGILYYTVTAYFKHPKLICSPVTPKGVNPGRGLYIQMGFNLESDYMHIAKETRHLSPLWRRSTCVPMMGNFYFMNLSRSQPCEKIYPLFLLYDREGNLAAFGWVFQGHPDNFHSDQGTNWFQLTKKTYPFLYNVSMLPPCMKNDNFQVFGIHIYLQDQEQLLCTDISNVKQRKVTQTPHHHTAAPPPRTYITALQEKRPKNINSENYAIEAIDSRSSGHVIYSNTHVSTLLFISILNFLCVKHVIQR